MPPSALPPVVRQEGLRRVRVTCDDNNAAYIKDIMTHSGIPAGSGSDDTGKVKLLFWISAEAKYGHCGTRSADHVAPMIGEVA
jgi:hypothetical protein